MDLDDLEQFALREIDEDRAADKTDEAAGFRVDAALAERYGIGRTGSNGFEIVIGNRGIEFRGGTEEQNWNRCVAWCWRFEREFGSPPRPFMVSSSVVGLGQVTT